MKNNTKKNTLIIETDVSLLISDILNFLVSLPESCVDLSTSVLSGSLKA